MLNINNHYYYYYYNKNNNNYSKSKFFFFRMLFHLFILLLLRRTGGNKAEIQKNFVIVVSQNIGILRCGAQEAHHFFLFLCSFAFFVLLRLLLPHSFF